MSHSVSSSVEPREALEPGDRPAPGALVAGRHRGIVWLIRFVLLASLVAAWQWYGSSTGGVFVPSMTQTLGRLPRLVSTGVLGDALWTSNVALLIGYPVSVIAGLVLGFLIGRKRILDRALSYWVDIAMVIPMVAIVPVVIVALGLSLTARVAVVILFALPVIVLNSRAAVRIIDKQLVEMAGAFAASKRQTWMGVILPAALPMIFTGLSIGIGRAISGMVVIELILLPVGLGGLLLDYRSSFAGSDLYAVTLVVIFEGVLLTSLARAIERRVTRRMREGRA
jgi:ABC-type nitrate/sulfonate/bicarbonate transport system permease component